METFGYTREYLTKNNEPWFPVMGEIHYSRLGQLSAKEELLKMKAGGVNIASTYCFWNHHEEIRGEFDFSGDRSRSLKDFLQACKEAGIYCFLRIGPWAHGEARYGGFPDWLIELERSGQVRLRSNDEHYLQLVRRFWEQLYVEAQGYFYKDGGPVIGVQIENEYGHVGGLTGEEGNLHMKTLQKMAVEIGFEVPYYTATGWGGAMIGDCLPVMGGYCEAPWDRSVRALDPNPNYLFSKIRNDAMIASDHHLGSGVTFDENQYPYLMAELGGGLQVTGHRRPVATGRDIGAMSLVKLGSGANLLGYYMYHGGTNPAGKLSTLEESTLVGDYNDLPKINYDFNAPIRQYGSISDTYKEIKLLAMFLNSFGDYIAPMEAVIGGSGEAASLGFFVSEKSDIAPADTYNDPSDVRHLRWAVRYSIDGRCGADQGTKAGFVFFNNYQRQLAMDSHKGVEFVLDGVKTGLVDIENGEYGFYPFNMSCGDKLLKYATATPLCKLNTKAGTKYVFYGKENAQFIWEDEPADIVMLTREQALDAYVVKEDKGYENLVISDEYVFSDGLKPLQRKILNISFVGDSLEIYDKNGNLLNDYFYTGQDVKLLLSEGMDPKELEFRLSPLKSREQVFIEQWPKDTGTRIVRTWITYE